MTVEDRLARMEAMLIGVWCANSPSDKFDEDHTNNETVMRLVSMTMDEVRAIQALGVEMLNVDCEDPPKKA
jgi:hypothetical protein